MPICFWSPVVSFLTLCITIIILFFSGGDGVTDESRDKPWHALAVYRVELAPSMFVYLFYIGQLSLFSFYLIYHYMNPCDPYMQAMEIPWALAWLMETIVWIMWAHKIFFVAAIISIIAFLILCGIHVCIHFSLFPHANGPPPLATYLVNSVVFDVYHGWVLFESALMLVAALTKGGAQYFSMDKCDSGPSAIVWVVAVAVFVMVAWMRNPLMPFSVALALLGVYVMVQGKCAQLSSVVIYVLGLLCGLASMAFLVRYRTTKSRQRWFTHYELVETY